jgi:hypothetical protein
MGPIPMILPFEGLRIYSIASLLNEIIISQKIVNLAITGFLLVLGIPVVVLIYWGLRMIFGFESRIRYFGLICLILWLIGISFLGVSAVHTIHNFSGQHHYSEEIILSQSQWPNIYLEMRPGMLPAEARIHYHDNFRHGNLLLFSEENLRLGIPTLRLIPSESETMALTISRESRGSSFMQAREFAENITYSFGQRDSLLILDPVFQVGEGSPWRAQHIHLELRVPRDKVVIIEHELRNTMNVKWGRNLQVVTQ